MKVLIDTHAFIWYATGDNRLSKRARDLMEPDNERLISIASVWEMAIKVNIGRLEFKRPFDEIIIEQFDLNHYKTLNIEFPHLFKLSSLELHHGDPFDRIIISQAIVEDIPVISVDNRFDNYPIKRIW